MRILLTRPTVLSCLGTKMEALYAIPYHILEVPNLKLKKPGWVKAPSAMFVFALVLLSYFLVTGGKNIIYFWH